MQDKQEAPPDPMSTPPFLALDLFAGAGGLGLGLTWAGFAVAVANEHEKVFASTYARNHPGTDVICGDILCDEVYGRVVEAAKTVDLIAGGPPCQGFSTVGKKDENDPRNKLFYSFLRLVDDIRPKVVLFENVSGFKRMYQGRAYTALIEELGELGYRTYHSILNGMHFGVPQTRARTFVVAFREPLEFTFPEPTHTNLQTLFAVNPILTLGDALSDLPPLQSGETSCRYTSEPRNEYQSFMRKGSPATLTEHEGPKHGRSLLHAISFVPKGGSVQDIPEELRPRSYFLNTYARLWWDRPSTTITRNFGTPSSSRCIHPFSDRGLTTREGARLQSFPDWYEFTGSRAEKNLQIGNAVPPILARAIGKAIVIALRQKQDRGKNGS